MKFIQNILNKKNQVKNDAMCSVKLHVIISNLVHDLGNDFVTLQLVVDGIKESVVQEKLSTINKVIDRAKINLEMVRLLTLPENERPSSAEKFSIADCINNAINTYPFPAKRYVSYFQIASSSFDFLVSENRHLITYVFYLLMKNAIKCLEIGRTCILISLDGSGKYNFVHIKMPYMHSDNNGYSLGLPSNYGNGFVFIKSILKGDACFSVTPENDFLITLKFPCIDSLNQN